MTTVIRRVRILARCIRPIPDLLKHSTLGTLPFLLLASENIQRNE